MEKAKILFYTISFLIFRPLSYIIPFRLYIELIKILSFFAAPFFNKRKRIAKNNLFLIQDFSMEQINIALNEGIKSIYTHTLLDFIIDKWSPENSKKYVLIEGKEHLQQALAGGKGVLLTFIHSNTQNVYLPCVGLIEKVYIIAILENLNRFSINSIHDKIREHLWESIRSTKFKYLNKKESVNSKIGSLLKASKIVAISADGLHAGKFFLVPFFNKKIKLPVGFAKLSKLFNAPIVPIFSGFDRKKNLFRVWLGNPIFSQTPKMAAEAFSAQFQEHLKKYPSHWTGWWRMKLVKDEKGEEFFQIYSI